jgi:chaperonin cofactor prefoldin
MPKKLSINSLSSEITTLNELLSSARQSGDIVGEMQLEHRIGELSNKLETLKEQTLTDNSASVALFFGGQPVLGSKGIAAEFAGVALEQFQNLIAKVFANNEVGDLGGRGRVPFKANSELMVTGLARGSFGFVLDEMSEQVQLESSELSHVIDKAALLLRDSAAQDDAVFEALLEELEPRTLIALRDIFSNLDSSKATIRIVEKELDFTLDGPSIHRAKVRTEATSIEETVTEIEGVLVGFLPEHRKFELADNTGKLFYGSATKEAVEQFAKATESVLGKNCQIKVTIKTVLPLNRPPREVVRLMEFLRFGE